MLPGRAGHDSREDQGVRPDRRGGLLLLPPDARGHLPQDLREGRAEPLYGGDCQHPRAVLLDPQGQGHRHGEGYYPGPGGHRQGPSQRPPHRRNKPRDQAGAGHRRRHCGHPDRPGHRRGRVPGGHRGEKAHHRRQDDPDRQDLPHPGLRGLHPDPEDGRRGPE